MKDKKYYTENGFIRSNENHNHGVDYDILAEMYIQQIEEISKLKQRNYNLVVENEFLKEEIVDLKTEIVDHRVKEYRITKILNETSDYT